MSDAELRLAGVACPYWTEVTVQRSLLQLAPSFDFRLVNAAPSAVPVLPSLPVEVVLDGATAITGFIDSISHVDQPTGGTSFAVRGRGKTADLVDCSARHSTGRFVQAGAQAILIQLCEPYGISVEVDPTMAPDALARLIADIVKPLKKFRLRVGDTPFAAIEKLAKERAFLVFESTRGTLVITRAGATPTTIIDRTRGEQWTRETDESNVFSEYEILGQHWGSNTWNGDDARGARGTIADDAATRFRPMTIVAERSVASADLTARATYERNQRRGLAERVGVTVSGWTYAPGLLWDIGQRVTLDNPFLGVTGEFLVYDVVMRRDRNGATTALTCAPPEAFEPFDPPKKKPEKRKTGKALDPLAIALASHTQLLATFAANLAGLKAKKVSK